MVRCGIMVSPCPSVCAFGVVAFSDRIAIDDYFKTSYGHMVTLKMHDRKNDGQRKLFVWKMQEWKMTDKNYGVWKMQDWKMRDKLLANYEHNYGVWKMQEYKSS